VRRRRYRLQPWLVRALIPPGAVGTYVLYRGEEPVYVGRSDRNLQQRLLQHAAYCRGEYFGYDVHWHPLAAFEVECSLYHALRLSLENVLHPDHPDYLEADCPFCVETLTDILANRLGAVRPGIMHTTTLAGTETSRLSHTEGAHHG
jgi:hypothetical protein